MSWVGRSVLVKCQCIWHHQGPTMVIRHQKVQSQYVYSACYTVQAASTKKSWVPWIGTKQRIPSTTRLNIWTFPSVAEAIKVKTALKATKLSTSKSNSTGFLLQNWIVLHQTSLFVAARAAYLRWCLLWKPIPQDLNVRNRLSHFQTCFCFVQLNFLFSLEKKSLWSHKTKGLLQGPAPADHTTVSLSLVQADSDQDWQLQDRQVSLSNKTGQWWGHAWQTSQECWTQLFCQITHLDSTNRDTSFLVSVPDLNRKPDDASSFRLKERDKKRQTARKKTTSHNVGSNPLNNTTGHILGEYSQI